MYWQDVKEKAKRQGIDYKCPHELPELPKEVQYLWDWHYDLIPTNGSISEMAAYFDLVGVKPTKIERDALMELNSIAKNTL